jgi:hypothetical protein
MNRMSRGGRGTGSGPPRPGRRLASPSRAQRRRGCPRARGRRSATRRGWPRWQRSSPPRRANAAVCPGRSAGSAARVCRVVGLGSDSSSALEAAQPPRLRRRPRAARDRLSGGRGSTAYSCLHVSGPEPQGHRPTSPCRSARPGRSARPSATRAPPPRSSVARGRREASGRAALAGCAAFADGGRSPSGESGAPPRKQGDDDGPAQAHDLEADGDEEEPP